MKKTESAAHVTEFAGMVSHRNNFPQGPHNNMNYVFDKEKDNLLILLIGHNREMAKKLFFYNSKSHLHLDKILHTSINSLTLQNRITLLWLTSIMRSMKNNKSSSILNNIPPKSLNKKERFSNKPNPPSSNMLHTNCYQPLKSTLALNVEHELQNRNRFAASNLEKGWIIDSGASAHMTPYKRDCISITSTKRTIFLADGSSVQCRMMGIIEIPIHKKNKLIGTLKLDDVLIVPNLDRRLFSVNSFLSKGNNWVHFDKNYVQLGINDGPTIKIPITSLQSNAMVVKMTKNNQKPKNKINANIIHSRFHRSDGAIATIKAHDLWNDVEVTQGIDFVCTSCKIMSIPSSSRGKRRESQISLPLEEIQVDTVPNPEPIGISSESRFNYFLILCDRYSRIFRLIGIKDKSSEACIDGIEQIISNVSQLKDKLPRNIVHIRSDFGSEFRSDTFRKWCGENSIRFTTAAPKHQEQNGLVERHWATITKMANTMLLHARLNKKFFYYAAKYAQRVHDVIPVKDLIDDKGLPTTPHFLLSGSKPNVKHFRVFGCPAVFKKYEFSDKGRRTKNKFSQQGVRGIFVGFPVDSAGWLFYVPDAKRTFISMDAVFDEEFTSPLCTPELPFTGAIRLRNIKHRNQDQDTIEEYTGEPKDDIHTYENDESLPLPTKEEMDNETVLDSKRGQESTKNDSSTKISAFFTSMCRPSEDSLSFPEYLNVAHELSQIKKDEDKEIEKQVNLSDFIPEPRSLLQILRMSSSTKDKWGEAIKSEITGLFDNDTFVLDEKPLPADEIIPAKLACKTKLNIYGGLDKLKARVCLRGDMQIKDDFISWSPTASTRLLKCFIADAIRNKSKIYQLDFIQAFIQSKATKRMFVILDKEFSHFCPKLSQHFGRPLRLNKCLYGADFSGKSWYDTLDSFLTNKLSFLRSRVDGCLYIYRKGNDWIKLINYVDDALYFASSNRVREDFELSLKNKFNLSLLGEAKWYLGMRITQNRDFISLDQDQYVKNITSRFEKGFKHPFKKKDFPLPISFVPTKKDSPATEEQIKETKTRFGNLHYRSIIGALLYVSCCTRPDICFAVNKLAKYANNPGVIHFRALLHLLGFLKNSSNKGLRFYSNTKASPLYQLLKENNIQISEDTTITFTDSSWNDCVDTGRSTGGNLSLTQGGAVDYGSHLPVPVAMSSGEAEYISAAVACMKASHLRMLIYDLRSLGSESYNGDDIKCEPSRIIVDNEAAISMARCNKDTAGNRHVARRYHYVRQGTTLKEHVFEWIGTKNQLADILTKSSNAITFSPLWSIILHEC